MKHLQIQKEEKVDLVQHEVSFIFLIIISMKYKIEWTFNYDDGSSIEGNTQIEDATLNEVQLFIMEWMPSLVTDIIETLEKKLNKKGMKEDTKLMLLNMALNMCCMNILKEWLSIINNTIDKTEDKDKNEDNDFNLFDRIRWAQQEK